MKTLAALSMQPPSVFTSASRNAKFSYIYVSNNNKNLSLVGLTYSSGDKWSQNFQRSPAKIKLQNICLQIINDRHKAIIMVTSCFLWYKTTASLSITVVCLHTERGPLVSKKGKTYVAVRQEVSHGA